MGGQGGSLVGARQGEQQGDGAGACGVRYESKVDACFNQGKRLKLSPSTQSAVYVCGSDVPSDSM